MEEQSNYTVKITLEAEGYYYQVLEYFYKHHTQNSANKKSGELLELAISLGNNPSRGRIEENLQFLGFKHRFILYYYTTRKAIKIVYVTDFFPCESDDNMISERSQ